MDDLVARCQEQLCSFRIKELKAILSSLGLSKQGKKQDLLDKIMALFKPLETSELLNKGPQSSKRVVCKEEIARLIDDMHRKIVIGAVDLASFGRDHPTNLHSVGHIKCLEECMQVRHTVQCPCGNSQNRGKMIQCDNKACGVWQHFDCVIFPELENTYSEHKVDSPHFCEICRVNQGDPFCETLREPLLSTNLNVATTSSDGSLQGIEKIFTLTKADWDLLHESENDLQVWCLLLDDKITFRMHWPKSAQLNINGTTVLNRPSQHILSASGRDDGPGIKFWRWEGPNKIYLSFCDDRPFCFGVRIIRRLTIQQVLQRIPKEEKEEPFEEALARVVRHIKTGACISAKDDDSDVEVLDDLFTLNMRCPNSGSRIRTAARFKPCTHAACFDLHVFVELNQCTRKWQCPICLKNYSWENLIIDPFINRIASAMKTYEEDLVLIEFKEGGFWRPIMDGEVHFLHPWHSPYDIPSKLLHHFAIPHVNKRRQVPIKVCMKRPRENCWRKAETTTEVFQKVSNVLPECTPHSWNSSAIEKSTDGGEGQLNLQPMSLDPSILGSQEGIILAEELPSMHRECLHVDETEEGSQLCSIPPQLTANISNIQSASLVHETGYSDLSGIQQLFTHCDLLGYTGETTNIENQANVYTCLQNFGVDDSQMWQFQQLNYTRPVSCSQSQLGSMSNFNFPIQPAPMQPLECLEFGLSQDRNSHLLGRGMASYGQPSQTLPFSLDSFETMNEPEIINEDTYGESSCQVFLSPRPTCLSSQSTVARESNIQNVEDSWFSLGLGGVGVSASQKFYSASENQRYT